MSLDVMEVDQQDDQPRRGVRVRRSVDKFQPTQGPAKKRRLDDEELEGSDDEASENDSEEERPTRRRKAVASTTQPKKVKTPRSAKVPKKAKARGEGQVNDGGEEAGQGELEGMKDDSPLFNEDGPANSSDALLHADIALNPLIEDWVDQYQSSAGQDASERESVHQLVLFVLRCCGLSATVEEDEVLDMDGIGDVVERIEEESSNTVAAVYPLISRTKTLKPFRSNLNTFLTHLLKTLSETPLLFHSPETTTHTHPILSVLLAWLHNLSTSALRPLRHTSTYITLKIQSALCDAASDVGKDLSLKQRQREAEAKKLSGAGKDGGGGTAAQQKRVKEAEKKVKEAHQRKVHLEELMKENVDVVRDSDAAIRTDCLKELGVWIKTYPDFFAGRHYLTYLTRGCNDPDSHARLETVKALSNLYSRDSFTSNARTHTLRLAPRLIEMSLKDVDISVRIRALDVVAQIDKTGILQDEEYPERDHVARLIFDPELRVRKAVGAFMGNIWEERKEGMVNEWKSSVRKKKKVKGVSEAEIDKYFGWKALAGLLLETSEGIDQELQLEANTQAISSGARVETSVGSMSTRAIRAIEALSSTIEKLSDWTHLVDYLLLDHSTSRDDQWLLTEEEEGFMTFLMIACVKADDEENEEERTKVLMNLLPRLIGKNQADTARMTGILGLTGSMKLEMYLDMRKTTAFESLWDDITKQFLTQTSPALLTSAIQAITTLTSSTVLQATNTAKIQDLQETLFTSLRDALNGEDVSMLSLDEEQVAHLEAILFRVLLLARSRDVTEVMADEEGGQSSGWGIVCAFAERGEVAYKEEAQLVEHAVQIVFLTIAWLFKRFTADDAKDDEKVAHLIEKRDRAVEVFQRLAIKDRASTAESVRRQPFIWIGAVSTLLIDGLKLMKQAFICFVNAHVLFSPKSAAPAAKAATLDMADEMQHRLEGAFQSAVERFDSDNEDSIAGSTSANDLNFYQLVSVFVAAIRTGVLEVDHAKEPLAHYGRFGPTYDAIVRKLVDVLRDEGIYNRQADTVQHVAGSALQASFTTYLDSTYDEPVAPLALAKLLSSAFTIHGTHFTVLKQLHPTDTLDFHQNSIDYICRKISGIVKQERANKQKEAKLRLAAKRNRALTFFKPLILLLGPVNGRDALKLKSHLEEGMSETEVPMSGTKAWEGYRQYEKRLVGIASRDNNVKIASQRVVQGGVGGGKGKGKRPAALDDNDDVELDANEDLEGEEELRERTVTLSPAPAPAARRNGSAVTEPVKNGRSLQRTTSVNGLETGGKQRKDLPVEDEEAGYNGEEDGEGRIDGKLPESQANGHALIDEDQSMAFQDEDVNLDLDLDRDLDFTTADFPDLSQGASQRDRERSVSVVPGSKKRKGARVI